jgi:hypothetical protein
MNQNRTPEEWRRLGGVFMALGGSQIAIGAALNNAFFVVGLVFLVLAFVFFRRAQQR